MNILAQAGDIIDTGVKLAQSNDRVLFIITLILFFIAGGFAVRWFMAQLDKRDARIEALSQEIGKVREAFTQYVIASVKELQGVIARNTETIEHASEVSERKMGLLARIEERVSK